MKLFDFWLQLSTLVAYIALSPVVYSMHQSMIGDASLMWVWVVVVTGTTSLLSLPIFIIFNFVVVPKKTYRFKVILPLFLSSFFAFHAGSGLNDQTEIPFLIGNFCLLLVLYLGNGLIFRKRLKNLNN